VVDNGTWRRGQDFVTRKGFIAGAIGAGAAIWAGCGSSETGGTAKPNGAPTGKPKRGGTFRAALTEEPFPAAFDMGKMGLSTSTASVAYLAFNGLVDFDAKGEVIGDLAESWERTNPTTFVFELRKGVVFHDGTPVDAKAVKAHFDRVQDPKTKSPRAIPILESCRARGTHTLEMRLSKPFAPFLALLRRFNMPIQSPTAVEKFAASDPFKASVGSGPYKFVSYRKGDGVTLERFEDYWKDTNYFDGFEFKIVPTQTTQVEALMNGDFDFIIATPESVDRVKSNPQITLVPTDANAVGYLVFNQKRAPFDKLEVRQAFSNAVDRDGIVNAIYHGAAKAAHGPLSPGFGPFYTDLSDVTAQQFDLEAGKKALASAGFDMASTVNFESFTETPWQQQADVMQQSLTSMGVKTKLHKADLASFASAVFDQRNYTIANCEWNTAVDPDETMTPMLGPGEGYNPTGLNDPKLAKLIDEGRHTYDQDKRVEIYHEASRHAAEQAYYAYTVHPQRMLAFSSRVQGFEHRNGTVYPVDECWFA
jgi:peptide/nickel transport system substrate-binding protein